MDEFLLPFQRRFFRWTICVILLIVLLDATHSAFENLWGRVCYEIVVGLLSIAALGASARARFPIRIYLLTIGSILLLAPWFLGGIRQPEILFALLFLHAIVFLWSMEAAWTYSALLAADVAVLGGSEIHGLVASSYLSETRAAVVITVLIVLSPFVVSFPLAAVRRAMKRAENHLLERRQNEKELVALKEELERRVAARTIELLEVRERLHSASRDCAAKLEPSVAALTKAARALRVELGPDPDTKEIRHMDRIEVACKRIEDMSRSLQDFSQLGDLPVRSEIIPPERHQELVKNLWEEVRVARPSCPDLDVSKLGGCRADFVMLRQIWQNLLSNAIKYSSKVEVPKVEILCDDRGFGVKDNGAGFDASRASKLFGLFQRLHSDNEFQGNGVGLASVKRMLELQNGSIWADSHPGEGATFRFQLPAL